MFIKDSVSIINYCEDEHLSLYEYALKYELSISELSEEEIIGHMHRYLDVMKQSIKQGLDKSIGGNGKIIHRKASDVHKFSLDQHTESASGERMLTAVAYGLAVMEVNVTMGRIVAAPTAGASGIIPGVFMSLQETFGLSDDKLVEGLFVASLVGALIARNASISGAKGGCQAEVGSGAAMAAVAGLYMLDVDMQYVFHGGAIALKNLMGLVCDPVAGLVEVPCQKRNAIGVADSLVAIDLVRAGMYSHIPFDEVVEAMKKVGDLMPSCHRETGTGGIANTKTGLMYNHQIFSE